MAVIRVRDKSTDAWKVINIPVDYVTLNTSQTVSGQKIFTEDIIGALNGAAKEIGDDNGTLNYSQLYPIYNWFTAAIGDTDDIINKWSEITSFLNGISDTDALQDLLNSYVLKTTYESFVTTTNNNLANKYVKAPGVSITSSNISTSSAGLPLYGSASLPKNNLVIGKNGIGMSSPTELTDGASIFTEGNGSNMNLVIAIGDDAGSTSGTDQIVFRQFKSTNSTETIVPTISGTIAVTSKETKQATPNTVTTTANRSYKVIIDQDGNLQVNVPWSDTTYTTLPTSWTSSTTNADYPLGFCTTNSPTSGSNYNNYYSTNLTYNPSTSSLKINGCTQQYDASSKCLKFNF